MYMYNIEWAVREKIIRCVHICYKNVSISHENIFHYL